MRQNKEPMDVHGDDDADVDSDKELTTGASTDEEGSDNEEKDDTDVK